MHSSVKNRKEKLYLVVLPGAAGLNVISLFFYLSRCVCVHVNVSLCKIVNSAKHYFKNIITTQIKIIEKQFIIIQNTTEELLLTFALNCA